MYTHIHDIMIGTELTPPGATKCVLTIQIYVHTMYIHTYIHIQTHAYIFIYTSITNKNRQYNDAAWCHKARAHNATSSWPCSVHHPLVSVCCRVLPCVVVCCHVLPCVAARRSVAQCGAECCHVWQTLCLHPLVYVQCVASCCIFQQCFSVLQRVAARCSVAQCVAVCCTCTP